MTQTFWFSLSTTGIPLWLKCTCRVLKARGEVAGATISIALVKQYVGSETVRHILVIHAMSGCDTTSAVFGHGKISAYKKLSASSLGHLCDAVSSSESSQMDVGHAGCELLVALYGGSVAVESLDKMRYTTYMKLCSSSKTAITLQQLPPTTRAAYYHSLRVHYQVIMD